MHRPIAHAILFIGLGPIFGVLSWFAAVVPFGMLFNSVFIGLFIFSVVVAYFLGAVPAALTGLAVGLVPRLLGHKLISLLAQVAVGAFFGGLFIWAVTLLRLQPDASQVKAAVGFTRHIWPHGASAGACCALVAWFVLKAPDASGNSQAPHGA